MNELLNLGFQKAGYWVLNSDGVGFVLEQFADCSSVIYAFVIESSVKYVGKTEVTLKQRIQQYKTPGPTQWTNLRNKDSIIENLRLGKTVEIYALINVPSSDIDAYEKRIIDALHKPEWNKQ